MCVCVRVLLVLPFYLYIICSLFAMFEWNDVRPIEHRRLSFIELQFKIIIVKYTTARAAHTTDWIRTTQKKKPNTEEISDRLSERHSHTTHTIEGFLRRETYPRECYLKSVYFVFNNIYIYFVFALLLLLSVGWFCLFRASATCLSFVSCYPEHCGSLLSLCVVDTTFNKNRFVFACSRA